MNVPRVYPLGGWISLTALMASAAVAQTAAPNTDKTTPFIAEVVVTAQRRSESLQNVPIAVSAFSGEALKAQRLDGGDKLELSVPNVNYSRGNFGGYNFQIRGIGTKVVAASGDAGVSFNIDQLPVAANYLGDADFFDVQRVEVLRGPQGTLYGRNATGGAVNIITAAPTNRFEGSLTGEYGNDDTAKFNGFVNLPLGDTLAVRLAGFYLNRDGFGVNSVTGDRVDGRNLGSGRISLAWRPSDTLKVSVVYEHFQENDNRNRVGKQLCISDPGKASVGGVVVAPSAQSLLSQGCLPGSLYQPSAYGAVNTGATLGGVLTNLVGLTNGNALASNPLQDSNLHDIQSAIDPIYEANENLVIGTVSWDVTPHLTVEAVLGYNENSGRTAEDYNRLVPVTAFNTTPSPTNAFAGTVGPGYPALYASLFPGGVVKDPQVGASNAFRSFDYGTSHSTEKTVELRLSSSFPGRLNFTFGGIFIDDSSRSDYDVESNGLTAYAQLNNALGGALSGGPIYIDPSATPNGQGHNYFDSRFSGGTRSYGVFGELYYQFTDRLKFTAGVRQTQDSKHQLLFQTALLSPGEGLTPQGVQKALFNATTGRALLEWTPRLAFTDHTLIYASYSRGYKGGGFNPPCATGDACSVSNTFAPEYIDAFEVGSKNRLLEGRLQLNLTGFYYNYSGYQISKIVNKTSVNENIDADIYGAEAESIWNPTRRLTLNANVGFLHTEIKSGTSIDPFNPTQGDPALTTVNGGTIANCVANTQGLARLLAVTGGAPGATLLGVCSGGIPAATAAALGLYSYGAGEGVSTVLTKGSAIGQGIPVDLSGRALPNSPDVTVSLGSQYVFDLPHAWRATLRGDYYWQASSFSRVFNAMGDRLRAWDNVNATLTFEQPAMGVNVQVFVKNAFDAQPITDAYLTDQSSGLFRNVFTLDPRTFGVSVTKTF